MPAFLNYPIDWDLTLLAARGVFLLFCFALAAVTFTRWRRAADRSTEHFAQATAQVLGRLAQIETCIEATQSCLIELSERMAAWKAPSYQIAIRMARGGAPREELIDSCGLSAQEAALVQRLHAPPAAARERLAAAG